MIKFYKDGFDSNIFGGNIYKLFIDKKIESEDVITNLLKNKDISYIFCFTTFNNFNIDILTKLGFRLISIRNIYKKIFDKVNPSLKIPAGYKIFRNSKRQIELSDIQITDIANVIGNTSRYFKDNKLPKKKSLNLYRNWIKNSLYRGYADESFVIFKNKSLAGIITLKIKPEGGYVDLIGIAREFQNKGLGGVLLQKGVKYLLGKKIKNMYTITEGENVPASRFYQKNGFILDDVQLVYHKNFRNNK